MKKQNTWMLVEAGMMIALAVILGEFVKIFEMPMGGSVTLGGMVPLFLFAFRWGGKQGMIAGAVYGLLDLVIGYYSMHPVALILDYPLAFAMIGLAGFFRRTTTGYIGGIITSVFARFLCHVVSGVIFYASYAPEGQAPLVYSILYNGTFLGPELVITVVLSLVILKFARLPEPKVAG
ncbi:MAG: energy-coupled thiamine transporter ThiT [Acetivibrionales bacterium]|nr:energy-coupled thiamine transporter ThiT [Bacillota bacterium]NLP07425.1 energy-coupled thiamine transporter ThiT [Clostridiaceae bacterium]HOA55108.1 energy-coupled thiamine transporter ThiT [Clostridiales bacterium]HPZ05188.1 energy-coupled thiamine transporter ThiT [Clostridiales bacterium]HQD31779.1 energy-coupled thiamine transporter ThiT [Clostridiales bacterium]